MRRLLLRIGAIAFGLAIAVAAVEILLQLGALGMWLAARNRSDGAGQGDLASAPRVVLCVGDSFTYGSGASSPAMSYPAQLELYLREHGAGLAEQWSVRNGGWPGRNSTELARRLPAFLASERPDYVCVLIGVNNRWNPAESSRPLPDLSTAPQDAGNFATWAWKWRTRRLVRIVADAYHERFGRESPGGIATSGSDTPVPTAAAIDTSDPVQALQAIRENSGQSSDVRQLHQALEDLRPRIRALADADASTALVLLLKDMARFEDAVAEGHSALERFGASFSLCSAMIYPLARLGRFDEALDFADEALTLAGENRHRIREITTMLRYVRRLDPSSELELRIRSLPMNERDLEFVLADSKYEPAVPAHEVGSILLRDLTYMREAIGQAGATGILLNYPGRPRLSDRLRAACDSAGLRLIDVEAVFAEYIESGRRDEVLIPDGHCNDRGYGMIAERVGRLILELEARP